MKRKVKAKAKKAAQRQQTPAVQEQEENKPFDFGGLPNRDLKKNLGCG